MSNDDLDRWDAFLRLTMDRALDYGVDSISVIDQIACTVAPHNSLSLLSSTRISDLLLSHLDISDARVVPTALCELVNDTLHSAYPPSEQNKLPSVWLLRTLTRTLDACPVELIEHLLESVQDGLCRWISDDCQILTAQEYDADIVSVYQTATVVLMTVPTKDAVTIEKFAGLLHSAFCGRDDKPESMGQSFLELWESTYASVVPPEDGWSEQITACLYAVGLITISEDETELHDAEEVEDQLLSQMSPVDDILLSPVVPSPESLAAPFTWHSPTRAYRELSFPTTPTMAKTRIPTPPRPHKTPSSPVHPLAPLLVFESPSRLPRSPTTPKKRTPGSNARKSDKENASPLQSIASVTERIAQRSPLAFMGSVLGKRVLHDEDSPVTQKHKKAKKDAPMVFADRSPVATQQTLIASQSLPSSSKTKVQDMNCRKRKNLVMDAIEVPTWREVMRRSASFDESDVAPTFGRLSPPVHKNLRQTRSTVKSGISDKQASPTKKRRTEASPRLLQEDSDEEDGWSSCSGLSSPLRKLRDMTAPGSGVLLSFLNATVETNIYTR